MKKGKKRLLKLAALGAAGTAGAILYSAKKEDLPVKRVAVEQYGEKAAFALIKTVADLMPDPHWLKLENYTTADFFDGHTEFADSAKRTARWSLGYARASLVPEDYLIKKYYIAGYLQFPPNVMSGVLDDQAVRAICLDDSSGRGAVVFAVIDCVGISNTDIRRIRAMLADFAKANGIAGINISATHCHSGIDTQGLWGDLPEILRNNVKSIKANRPEDVISGKNPAFMDRLRQTVADTIMRAYADMRKGVLYSSKSEGLKYNRDKRPPDVKPEDIVSLRFVPDDGSRETAAVFAAAHAVSLGAKNTLLSSDYIYYAEQVVNEADKNFIFFQGAELAIATSGDFIPEAEPEDDGFKRYGRAIGRYIVSIPKEKETKVEPILNFRAQEIFLPCNGEVLRLAAKLSIVNNRALSVGSHSSDACFVSEIGYAELGSKLAFALIPGELAPEILQGGAYDEKESYTKKPWNYRPMKDMVDGERQLTVIGLCNDSIGYIIPDNDFGSVFAPLHYEEAVSAGNRTGSSIVTAFERLVDDCGRRAD